MVHMSGLLDELQGSQSMHDRRLARALASQILAEGSSGDAAEQFLHALSRYGVWASSLAQAVKANEVTPAEASRQLEVFAEIQEWAFSLWMSTRPDLSLDTFADVSERDMDFLLLQELECNGAFLSWFLERTDAGGRGRGDLVQINRSVATYDGETDLLVVYRHDEGHRRAVMIENKVGAAFTNNQAGRYRIRGEAGKRERLWDGYCTVLAAPRRYLDGLQQLEFDYAIAYEDIERFFAAQSEGTRNGFRRRMLSAAISKSKQPWTRRVDEQITQFFAELREFAVRRFPDLEIRADRDGRAPSHTWVFVNVPGLPKARVLIEIKAAAGIVDLRLNGVKVGELRRAFVDKMTAGLGTAAAGKSCSLQFVHPAADVRQPFETQKESVLPLLESADRLRHLAVENQSTIIRLLGYDQP